MYGFPVRHGKTQTTSLPHVFSENTRPLPPFSQTLLDTYPTQAVLGKLNDKKTNAKPKQRGKTEEKYQCQKLGPKWRFQWFQMPTRQFFFLSKVWAQNPHGEIPSFDAVPLVIGLGYTASADTPR